MVSATGPQHLPGSATMWIRIPGGCCDSFLVVPARSPIWVMGRPTTLQTVELSGVQPRKLETGGSVCLLSLTEGGLFVRARQVTASVKGR